jgi:hypothetical protein
MNSVSGYYGSTTIARGGNKIASYFNPGLKFNFGGILIHLRRGVCRIYMGYVGHDSIGHYLQIRAEKS